MAEVAWVFFVKYWQGLVLEILGRNRSVSQKLAVFWIVEWGLCLKHRGMTSFIWLWV